MSGKRNGRFLRFLKVLITLALVAGIVGGIVLYVINALMKKMGADQIVTSDQAAEAGPFDCILVLGCQVRADGTPSDMLRDRIRRGVELYQKGAAPILLLTGDSRNEDYDEVGVMKRVAMESGVPEDAIVTDPYGLSTYDSFTRAAELFSYRKIVIVTQEYHLYRSLYIAGRCGMSAVGVDAEYVPYAGQTFRDIREVAARAKDWLFCLLKPAPEMGYRMPGDGD